MGGGGGKNCPKLCEVIYGRPLSDLAWHSCQAFNETKRLIEKCYYLKVTSHKGARVCVGGGSETVSPNVTGEGVQSRLLSVTRYVNGP